MKRNIKILLSVLLAVLLLCSCTSGRSKSVSSVSLEEFWELLDGYWTDKSNDFVQFDVINDRFCYAVGTWNSDYWRSGTASDINEIEPSIFVITVTFPALEATMLNEAYPELTQEISIDISTSGKGYISIMYPDGLYSTYYLTDESVYHGSSADAEGGIVSNEVWSFLEGSWQSAEGDVLMSFSSSNSILYCSISNGDTFLGKGSIVLFQKLEAESYKLAIYFPADANSVYSDVTKELNLVVSYSFTGGISVHFADDAEGIFTPITEFGEETDEQPDDDTDTDETVADEPTYILFYHQ